MLLFQHLPVPLVSSIAALRAANSHAAVQGATTSPVTFVHMLCPLWRLPVRRCGAAFLYLGSADYEVYLRVFTTAHSWVVLNNNPFASVGAQYGSAKATGNSTLVESFEARSRVISWSTRPSFRVLPIRPASIAGLRTMSVPVRFPTSPIPILRMSVRSLFISMS